MGARDGSGRQSLLRTTRLETRRNPPKSPTHRPPLPAAAPLSSTVNANTRLSAARRSGLGKQGTSSTDAIAATASIASRSIFKGPSRIDLGPTGAGYVWILTSGPSTAPRGTGVLTWGPPPPSAHRTRRRIAPSGRLPDSCALDSPATANDRKSRTTPAPTPNKTQSQGENTGSSAWFGQKFGLGQPGALLRNAVHGPISTAAGTDAVRRTCIALVSRDMSSITMAAATPKNAHCQSANRGPGLHNQNAAQDDELGGLIVTDIPAIHRPTPTPRGSDARRSAFLRVSLIQTMLPRPGVPVPGANRSCSGEIPGIPRRGRFADAGVAGSAPTQMLGRESETPCQRPSPRPSYPAKLGSRHRVGSAPGPWRAAPRRSTVDRPPRAGSRKGEL